MRVTAPDTPVRGRLVFNANLSILVRPAGERALHRVGVRELPSGVYQDASQVFQLKGFPTAHNCAATVLSDREIGP